VFLDLTDEQRALRDGVRAYFATLITSTVAAALARSSSRSS
jgi:hypothetical protein